MTDKVIPVRVALRIRPLNSREKADACTECLRAINGQPQVILGKDKAFTYDFIFSQQTPQIDVYEISVQPLLDALFKGYNATVLAYGQTGSGKTHTMGSGYSALSSATATLASSGDSQSNVIMNLNDLDDVGVIPRVLNDLFAQIEDEQRSKDTKFTVKVSFVEVYNEEIKDLFSIRSQNGQSDPLNIREENNTIKVVNLSEIVVTNSMSTIQLLERGSSLRVVGGTAMNDQSSRSHAIFTITLEQSRVNSEAGNVIKSKFHLVDLAGSERQSKTKAEGIRLKEGININLGLLALGNVISVLGEDSQGNKSKHVPYRESKLTRLLQDSLGGNSHTVMIACVSPADSNLEESLNTLRYADRARKIKNKPVVNIDPQVAELNGLRLQVQELKANIYQLTGGSALTGNFSDNSTEVNRLKDDNEKLRTDNSKLLIELQKLLTINRITYEKNIQFEIEKEDHEKKFEDIKATFEKFIKESQASDSNPNADNTLNTNKSLITELQSKLGEFEQLKEKEQSVIQEPEQDINLENGNEPIETDYALRQAKMQCQLSEYDTELAKKENLFRNMIENNLNSRLETNMDELKNKIECLEKEKEDLLDLIRNGDSSSRKLADQKRDRLKQLEGEVFDLKKKEKEFNKMQKLKEENEKHCDKLRNEIQNIKQERVKLIKQMRADTETFRKFRQEKEKEVNQLKAQERKRMVEINKLQEGNHRQEAVLRRKNEEISRIQRQLRETLEKQKQVAEKRQQTFDRKDASSLADKLRIWVTQELELSVNIAEARINLSKLIEERKESAAELTRLNDKHAELSEDQSGNPPSNKRKCNGNEFESNGEGDENLEHLEQRIERLKEDIECKSMQITEIQQMVIDGEQDDRSKHMFNNLHGVLEAKVLLKHLYNSGVQYLLESKLKQIQFETNANSMTHELKEMKKKYDLIEEEHTKSRKAFSKEINDLHQHYEQRILYLLKSSLNDSGSSIDDRYNILFEQLQIMEKRIDPEQQQAIPQLKRKELGDLTNKDEHRRTQRLKRDHRRTRVIRTLPEFDVSSVNLKSEASANGNSADKPTVTTSEFSPAPSPSIYPEPTEDDTLKDPDWAKTPLRPSLRKSKSRSQSSMISNSCLTENPESGSNE